MYPTIDLVESGRLKKHKINSKSVRFLESEVLEYMKNCVEGEYDEG